MNDIPKNETKVIEPGSVIGVIGGGQLGRMMAIAAAELGYLVHIFTPEHDAPASHVAFRTTVGSYSDAKALQAFAKTVSVITFEFENIPHQSLELLEKEKPVFPSASVLKVSRHRNREKTFISGLGVATAPFHKATSLSELNKAIVEVGMPAVLKTAELGYDGKGQVVLRADSNLASEWQNLNTAEAIIEKFIDFRMEISVLVARSLNGELATYVPVQNIHKNHILDTTIAPADISDEKTSGGHAQQV